MKSPRSPTKRHVQVRQDRHSGTGLRGLPKKNGAGGKTVWGSEMDQAPVACLDKNDPNYDSDKDTGAVALPELSLSKPDTNNATAPKADEQSSTPGSANNSPSNTSSALPVPEASD